jgi:uncharacterized membrane protein
MDSQHKPHTYTFPLFTGAAPHGSKSPPEFQRGQPMTRGGYALVIGTPIFTLSLIVVFGALAIAFETLTTVCPTCCLMLYVMTLGFYIIFDVPWRIVFQSQIDKIYYEFHGTDVVLGDGPGRLPLMMIFYPLAAASNLFLVILPSLEQTGFEHAYFNCAFRAMINGAWAYGTMGAFQSITFPRFPLELSALNFLVGSLLSLGASLCVMGVAESMELLKSAATPLG